MKHSLVDGDTPFLPQDIIRSVLKRLPVKSLIRFQCVCKHWENLIKTPSFIADHLHYSTHQNPSLLFHQIFNRQPLHLSLLDCHKQVHQVQRPRLIDSSKRYSIIGSINGLLCFSAIRKCGVSHHSFSLWNPATREVKQVPAIRAFDSFECNFIGFGFNPIVNDYVIVATFKKVVHDHVVTGAEVYSLSTGSWKEIELANFEAASLSDPSVATSGVIFWHGRKRDTDENKARVIVSFDIGMEAITLIPRPALPSHSSSKLTVYEDKLAMLASYEIGDSSNYGYSVIDLWVMEESINSSGERWRWTKKYTSSPYASRLALRTILRNEIICIGPRLTESEMESDEPEVSLRLINLITNELKVLPFPWCEFACGVFNYVESLVPIGNIQHEEEP